MLKTIDVDDAQVNLKELLSLVKSGTEIVLTEGNIPLARLIPAKSENNLHQAGLHLGAIWTSDDFDEPLPEVFFSGEG
jgi:antitoxin (DNA-binding transcriptional repressor) of toxin-antitoxin stability system